MTHRNIQTSLLYVIAGTEILLMMAGHPNLDQHQSNNTPQSDGWDHIDS